MQHPAAVGQQVTPTLISTKTCQILLIFLFIHLFYTKCANQTALHLLEGDVFFNSLELGLFFFPLPVLMLSLAKHFLDLKLITIFSTKCTTAHHSSFKKQTYHFRPSSSSPGGLYRPGCEVCSWPGRLVRSGPPAATDWPPPATTSSLQSSTDQVQVLNRKLNSTEGWVLIESFSCLGTERSFKNSLNPE